MFSQGTMTPMSTTFQLKMVESKLSWPWTSASYALLSPNGRMTQTWRTTAVDFGILPYEYFWTLEVAGLVVVASQHNTHNVLANIVHITLHCGLTNDHPPTLTGNLKGAEAGKSLALFHQLSTNKHQPMDNMNQPTESRQFYHQPMDFFFPQKNCGFMVHQHPTVEVALKQRAQVPNHQHNAVVLGLIRIFTSIEGLGLPREI